jgi:hypothetical protein
MRAESKVVLPTRADVAVNAEVSVESAVPSVVVIAEAVEDLPSAVTDPMRTDLPALIVPSPETSLLREEAEKVASEVAAVVPDPPADPPVVLLPSEQANDEV